MIDVLYVLGLTIAMMAGLAVVFALFLRAGEAVDRWASTSLARTRTVNTVFAFLGALAFVGLMLLVYNTTQSVTN